MFSAEYLNALAGRTGFQTAGLQKQMSLIVILREIQRHPLLSKAYVLKGGTAINLFWYDLPRLSVDSVPKSCLPAKSKPSWTVQPPAISMTYATWHQIH
jgi:Nucleotidyl transferase AbiEii toxin, Type IV TA system